MSTSTELVLSGEKVTLTVRVPATPVLPERVIDVQVPVEIAERYPMVGKVEEITELTAEVFGNTGGDGLGIGDLTRIKVPSGDSVAFTIGEDPHKKFSGVIILMQNRMNYWEKSPEESGGMSAPDCYSRDGKNGKGWYGKGGKFAARNPSGRCETCPMAQWTEDGQGNRTPSPCKPQVAVLIMMEGRPFPVMLTVPRTSMKPLKEYWKRTLLVGGMKSFAQVVTSFGLAKDTNAGGVTFNRITFAEGDDLGRDVKQVMLSLGEQFRPVLAEVDTSQDTEPPARPAAADVPRDEDGAFVVDDVVDDDPAPGWDPTDHEDDAYADAQG